MAQAKTLKLVIDVDNTDDGVKQLLKEIKPLWEWNNVERQILTGGFSCVMMRCYDNLNPEDSVTIRIRNSFTMLDSDQHEFEIKVLKHLCEIEYFPGLIATFDNGYCYQFIPGKPAVNIRTGDLTLTDTVLKTVAEKLVQLHVIKVPDTNMKQPNVFQLFSRMIKNSNSNISNPRCPSKEVLLNECTVLENLLQKLNPEIVLCHGDAHPGNVVWNDKTENATFVDWEFSHIGFQYTDVAHFIGIAGSLWEKNLDGVSTGLKLERIPKDLPEKFCTFYYKEWCMKNNETYTEQEFQHFLSNVEKFKTYDAFELLVFSATLPEDKNTDFIADIPKFLEKNSGIYLEMKEKYFGMNTFG